MPKVHYCCSNYDRPITDLNPLILQAYPRHDILVICAREGQQIRLKRKQKITVASWWDHDAFKDVHNLLSFDVVVILDRDRIDPIFHNMLSWVERTLHASS